MCWQETEHSFTVNGTDSNTSFCHKQDHTHKVYMSLYVYATLQKLLALYFAFRQPFHLGLPVVVRRNMDVLRLRERSLKWNGCFLFTFIKLCLPMQNTWCVACFIHAVHVFFFVESQSWRHTSQLNTYREIRRADSKRTAGPSQGQCAHRYVWIPYMMTVHAVFTFQGFDWNKLIFIKNNSQYLL